jgi:glycosyltransferase involved in cell wall biosynthesis
MVSNLAPYSDVVLSRCGRAELRRNRALRIVTDRSMRRADCVFVQSQQSFDLIPLPGLREKSVVSPPPAPPAPPSASTSDLLGVTPEQPYLLVVGDLNSYKGVETVIEAISLLRDPPLLVVCGHNREPEYVQALNLLAERRGVAERVRLMGSTPHDDVLSLMRGAVACVASSRFENFSRVPGEAMSAGTPVIACDIPAYREGCGDAALYYQADDADSLAKHLGRLIENPGLRGERRRAGVAMVERHRSENAPEVIMRALESLARDRARG